MKRQLRSPFRKSLSHSAAVLRKQASRLRAAFGGRFESLERRQLLAAHPLVSFDGSLADGEVSRTIALSVSAPDAGDSGAPTLQFTVSPTGDSVFRPLAPSIVATGGAAIALATSNDGPIGGSGISLASLIPGDYTVSIGGVDGSTGDFRFEVFLPGDTQDGNGSVDENEHRRATAAGVQFLGTGGHVTQQFYRRFGIDMSVDLYDRGADADADGDNDNSDLRVVHANHQLGTVTVTLDGDVEPGDQTAPAIEVALANDTGTDPTDGITTDVTITGTVTDEGSVESLLIGVDGDPDFELLDRITLDANGGFTVTPDDLDAAIGGPLAEGAHTVRFVATDEAGNTTAPPVELSFTFTSDQIPEINLTLNNDTGVDNLDGITTDATISGVVTDDDVIGSLLIGVDGDPSFELLDRITLDASGAFTVTLDDLEAANGQPLEDGPHTVRVIATDSGGNMSPQAELSFTFISNNQPPTIATIADQTIAEDSTFQLDANGLASDPDVGDRIVTTTITGQNGFALPNWLSFDSGTNILSGSPGNDDVGTSTLQLTASDTQGVTASGTFLVTVTNVNDAPSSTAIPDQTVDEDSNVSFDVSGFFSDVDSGDVLTFSAELSDGSPLPDWLSLGADDGIFSGTPTDDNLGTISISVQATDAAGSTASEAFSLTVADVNEPPTLLSEIENERAIEDLAFRYDINSFFGDFDPDDTLSFTATLEDGSDLPGWLALDADTGVFTGTPTNDDVATLSIVVTATDRFGADVSDTFTLFVINVNDPPTLVEPIADQGVVENVSFSIDVSSSFSEVDPGDNLVYLATLADGSPLPDWISLDDNGVFRGRPSSEDIGSITIRVQALDAGLESVTDEFVLTVVDANDPPTVVATIADQSVDQSEQFILNVSSSFDDVDEGDILTYSAIDTAAGVLPTWLILDSATGDFTGTPANDDVGTMTLEVTATDDEGASVSTTFQLTVNNVNDAPVIQDQSFSISPDAGDGANVGTVAASDPDMGDSLTFAIIDGDPSSIFSIDGSTGVLSIADASQLSAGQSIALTVQVSDSGDPALSETATITVEVTANNAPTTSGIPDQQTDEDSSFSFDISGFFNDIDPGDSLTFRAFQVGGANVPFWLSFDGNSGVFSGTPENGDVGTVSIEVTATDTSDQSVSDTFDLTVINTNDPPSVSTIPNQNVDEDSTLDLDLSNFFSDPDIDDTLTFSSRLTAGGALPPWISVSADGQLTATPGNDEVGTTSILVAADDAAGERVSASLDIIVANTNDAPVANDDSGFATNNTTTLTIPVSQLTGNDSDPDVGDMFSVTSVQQTSTLGASVILNGGQVEYDPTSSTELASIQPGSQRVDTFQYTIEDADGANSTATVSVTVSGSEVIRFRLETTDSQGNAVSSVPTGETFTLRVFVEDLRDNPSGVFSAYMDVMFDSNLATPGETIEFGPQYNTFSDGQNKLNTPGLIDEVGSLSGFTPLGGGEFLFFMLDFTAGETAGTLTFTGDAADEPSIHDVLFFEPPEVVDTSLINYGQTSIEIVSGGQNFAALSPSAFSPPLSSSLSTATAPDTNAVDTAHAQLSGSTGLGTSLSDSYAPDGVCESTLCEVTQDQDIVSQWSQSDP